LVLDRQQLARTARASVAAAREHFTEEELAEAGLLEQIEVGGWQTGRAGAAGREQASRTGRARAGGGGSAAASGGFGWREIQICECFRGSPPAAPACAAEKSSPPLWPPPPPPPPPQAVERGDIMAAQEEQMAQLAERAGLIIDEDGELAVVGGRRPRFSHFQSRSVVFPRVLGRGDASGPARVLACCLTTRPADRRLRLAPAPR
jgi:hypothetical protein